jgi:hypothetical protein
MEVEVMEGNKEKVGRVKRLEEMARVAVESYSRGRVAQFRDKKDIRRRGIWSIRRLRNRLRYRR